ncbi:myosin-binding protein 3 [Cinnamomum micranthum f. kanehirae]|uniref:Myosin-binding protein 3 n=1 Tax=Cinnamomum micranthum f. kanehirae TaxID=337451 RepID=A0A3S3M5B8_9MAGN|nr:myosin-binding protein 3 [Cinnamomum micranthum f. kanehirae]
MKKPTLLEEGSNLGDVSVSKILLSWWKFVKDSNLLSVENSEGDEKMSVEDNVFMDCRNGNCSHTLFKARKWVDLRTGFCSGNGVGGVCCSNILSCGIGFWRLMKNLIFCLVMNLNGDGNIDDGGGNSDCYRNEEGFAGFGNRINSESFKAREEEEVFEECEEGDFEEHRNAADDVLDFINENYLDTFIMRKFMEEDDDDDDDWEYEGEKLEENEELDLMGLKNALRIERERRNAAYLELEKERLAAASAAIETMAMIQRLQNEKNLIEMEARQYRYMAEQKQIYDQEVIHHLQWIISTHELERSARENQLKQCRKRLQQGGVFDEIVGEAEEHQDDETMSDLGLGDQFK